MAVKHAEQRRPRSPLRRPDGTTPDRGHRAFLYEQVTEELRRRIHAGVYRPGLAIPTEKDLVREFAVSAITVRRAVRELTAEGLLFSQQGLGVFVTDSRRIVRTLGSVMTSMAEEMRRGGHEPSFKERGLELVPASGELARRLGIRAGTRVYRHEKTVLADNEPIGVDTTVLPSDIGDLVRNTLSDEFLIPLLARHGIRVDHQDYRFEGGVLTREDATALGLPAGFPVIVVSYTAFDEHGKPLCAGRTIARSDRFSYEFCEKPGSHLGR
jgi:GntR family transcriptional regulator